MTASTSAQAPEFADRSWAIRWYCESCGTVVAVILKRHLDIVVVGGGITNKGDHIEYEDEEGRLVDVNPRRVRMHTRSLEISKLLDGNTLLVQTWCTKHKTLALFTDEIGRALAALRSLPLGQSRVKRTLRPTSP